MKIIELKNKCYYELKLFSDTALLDVDIILSFVLNVDRIKLIIYENLEISKEDVNKIYKLIEERKKGKPIAYIIGKKEFRKLSLCVTEDVLIPRPDTEVLCEKILEKISKFGDKRLNILEIGVGSGAISISVLCEFKNVFIDAIDISKEAINIAKKNSDIYDVSDRINFIECDILSQKEFFNLKKYDIIFSNPPYIETNEIQYLKKDVLFEPNIALDGGEDGLLFYRRITEISDYLLKENGYLLYEIGYNQLDAVINIMKNFKFVDIESFKDYQYLDRVVIGRKTK